MFCESRAHLLYHVVEDFPVNHCEERPNVLQVIAIDGQRVAVNHYNVNQLSLLDASLDTFLPRGVCAGDGVSPDRLHWCYRLLWAQLGTSTCLPSDEPIDSNSQISSTNWAITVTR